MRAAAATAAAAALVSTSPAAVPAAASPLTVRASFDSSTVAFGAPVRTRVVVLADPAAVDPRSVRIVSNLGPLTVFGAARTSLAESGGIAVVTLEREAGCLAAACVATRGDATPALPRVTVSARSRSGETLHASATWPALHVRGRVTAADLAKARPPFRVDRALPVPSYSIAPSTLSRLLDAAAVVLGLAALTLAASAAIAFTRRRRRAPPVDELRRALRLAREAESRAPADRRRALGLLARLLAARDSGLAGAARELAWSKPPPQTEQLAELVGDVERGVAP